MKRCARHFRTQIGKAQPAELHNAVLLDSIGFRKSWCHPLVWMSWGLQQFRAGGFQQRVKAPGVDDCKKVLTSGYIHQVPERHQSLRVETIARLIRYHQAISPSVTAESKPRSRGRWIVVSRRYSRLLQHKPPRMFGTL